MRNSILIATLLLAWWPQWVSAESEGEGADLVLRNVILPDPGDASADVGDQRRDQRRKGPSRHQG
jgi:hypothetical protein